VFDSSDAPRPNFPDRLCAARQQRRAAVLRHNSLLNLQAVLNQLVPLW